MRQPINTIVGTLLIVAACGTPWVRVQNQPIANAGPNITVRNGGGGFGGGFLPYGGGGYGGFGMVDGAVVGRVRHGEHDRCLGLCESAELDGRAKL